MKLHGINPSQALKSPWANLQAEMQLFLPLCLRGDKTQRESLAACTVLCLTWLANDNWDFAFRVGSYPEFRRPWLTVIAAVDLSGSQSHIVPAKPFVAASPLKQALAVVSHSCRTKW